MSDQAPAQRETFDADNAVPRHLPAWGEPRINGINRIGLWSLYRKEVRRFFKVQTQTVWAPAFTTLLFLVIFSVALGRGGREILGVPFESFLAPGLIVMAMMQNSDAKFASGCNSAARLDSSTLASSQQSRLRSPPSSTSKASRAS